MENLERNERRTKIGTVVSDKMDKTITVAVVSNKRHPIYGKVFKQTKKFKAHDELNEAHVGDTVEIQETRHLSKDKYFRLLRVIERAR
jgi:small subunit ribosomal protein S17